MNSTPINTISVTQTVEHEIRSVYDYNNLQEVYFRLFLLHSYDLGIRVYLGHGCFVDYRVEYGELVWGGYELFFPVIGVYQNIIGYNQSMNLVA